MRPVPYPPETRAKGWRFEIDYEKIEQSDTWPLAAEVPMAQPALLMMWLAAWIQEPAGSFPNDENLIRAKCKIPPAVWAKLRNIMMRGWWLAEDGRLYHDTLATRVLEMLEYRRKTAERVAKHKAALREQHGGNALPTQSEQGKNDTGTGTGTGTGTISTSLRSVDAAPPVCPPPPKRPAKGFDEEFEAAWTEYPSRVGGNSKADAFKAWSARRKDGASAMELIEGVRRYAQFVELTSTEPRFVKQAATFFGPGLHFRESWAPPDRASPRSKQSELEARNAATAQKILESMNVPE